MLTDRLFFHSASADRAPGAGRHESVADPAAYSALARIPNWRKMLSNFWVADFVWNGLGYRTVEHCFQAAKLAIVDPELARGFALESQSALSQGDGLAARKQRKLVAAAGLWLQRRPALARLRQRYDVVAFRALDEPPEWVRDAWRPG